MFTSPGAIAFTVFGIDVRWYGICVAGGILLASLLAYHRAPKFKIDQEHLLDVLLWSIPIGIIGARAYYVIFNWQNYKGDFFHMINFREGGLAIHGGLILGIFTAFLVCRYHKILFRDVVDLIAPSIALGQAIGRWGNFFNSEAHGGPTDLPWAVIVNGQGVHPTFLYESIWCFLLFIFLLVISRNRKFPGQIICLYAVIYSVERFFVEALRTDSLMIGPFKQAQVLSLTVIIAGIILYFILSKVSQNSGKKKKA